MKAFVTIFSVILMILMYNIFLPTLSPAYEGGFLFWAICLVIVVAIGLMWWKGWEECTATLAIGLVGTMALLFIFNFIGSRFFNAGTMREQLGTPEVVEFDEMIKQIDTSQIPIVDRNLAKKQSDKKIGEDVALGSRIDLGKANIQNVNGEIIYVTPLEHNGFFKWNEYRSTPGYITISASNPNKVKYVSEIDGKKINIFYSNTSYFGYDLKRYIRSHGFRYVGLTEYTFEINDEGYPFWVVTTYKNRTFFGNPEATGVVVVDAQTGDINWYGLNEIPDWVDIVQPEEFIQDQIDHWGELVHGAFNWSNKDKIKKTDLLLTVYVNGQCYYFTGMTSVGSDDSCVGFIMVNTRTKESKICYMSGATENAAMNSAEGLVSDYGYTATEPLPLNVNGIPTYVVALKDGEGLIKAYAMVNVDNYSIAAKGSSLQETSRAYVQSVARNSTTYAVGSNEAFGYTCEGIVTRIAPVVEDGSTYFYLMVEGEDNRIFMAPYTVSDELSVTREGDSVKISYIDDKNGTVDIIEFDNISFEMEKSEQQEQRDQLDEGTSVLDSKYNEIVTVNPEMNEETWNNLTDEEKAKLIEEYLEDNTK